MKRIIFPILTNIDNVNYSSGTMYSIYNNLKLYYEIVPVGPLKQKRPYFKLFANFLYRRSILKKKFATVHIKSVAKYYGQQINEKIRELDYDAIFCTSTIFVPYIETHKPIFAYTDFSFINAIDYYEFGSNLYKSNKKEALYVDKLSFKKAKVTFIGSEWAKNITLANYELEDAKIEVVARGANLVSPDSLEQIKYSINNRFISENKYFLFVGVDWYRKGGDIVYDVVKQLREIGYMVNLKIVGCQVPNHVMNSEFVSYLPFLDRKKNDDENMLIELFDNAFAFFMPTRAEAMGIVFAEAASFGLVSISTKTGGVEAVIEDGNTGILLNINDSVTEVVKRVLPLMNDRDLYVSYSQNSLEKFQRELNWQIILHKIYLFMNKSL